MVLSFVECFVLLFVARCCSLFASCVVVCCLLVVVCLVVRCLLFVVCCVFVVRCLCVV